MIRGMMGFLSAWTLLEQIHHTNGMELIPRIEESMRRWSGFSG
jgi:hypothetical protein